MRKILLYTHALAGGGAERVLALLACGLAERGHEVLLATDYEADANERFLDDRVRRIDLGAAHGRAILALARVLVREKPDVSISALGASNLKHGIAAIVAGRRRHAIVSYHGYSASEPSRLSRTSFAATPLLSRATGATIAVSNGLRHHLVKAWGAQSSRTVYVPNPVQWPPDAKGRAQGDPSPPLILACGRLTAAKNFAGLLRAFANIERTDARLVILGEGEERAALEASIVELGLVGRVELPGYAQPWAYYEQASCLAVSSLSESFGMVIVEALAYGVPVVATDCGGPREILNAPDLGLLVPLGDDGAMTAALDRTLFGTEFASARRARAADFSVTRSVDAYEALIETVIARAGRRSGSISP